MGLGCFATEITNQDPMKIHSRALPETRKRLKFNWRLFIGSLLFLGIVIPAGYFVHQSQLGRVSKAMSQRAAGLKEKQEWLSSANAIDVFLLLDPENGEQKVELAEVLDKALPDDGSSASSFNLLNRIIAAQARALGVCEVDASLNAREPAIRRRMVQRLIQAGRLEDAMDQIGKLAGPSIDPSLMKSLSLCRYSMALEKRSHSFNDSARSSIPDWLYNASTLHVVDLLLKAIIDNPGDVEVSSAIAEVCLGNPEFLVKSELENKTSEELRERAVSVMDKMLASNRENLAAWLAHYSIVSRLDVVRAESDIRQVLSMDGENPIVLREAGNHYMARAMSSAAGSEPAKKAEWMDLADKYFSQAVEKGIKRDGKVYLGMGEIVFLKGDFDRAVQIWEDGARVSTAPTALLWFRISQAWAQRRDLNKLEETLKSMDESIRNESSLLSKRGQTTLNRVASQQWATYYALQGDFVRAGRFLEEVVAKDQEMDPENRSEVIASLGLCYLKSGQFDRAVEAYQDAAGLGPSNDAHKRGLVDALAASNRLREAIDRMELINEKSGKDFIRTCELILDYQRRNQPDPGFWVRFDAALKQAASLGATDPFLIERRWMIDFLQIDSAMDRSDSQSQEPMRRATGQRLLELSDQYPESFDLQRLIIQKLDQLEFNEESRKLFAKVQAASPKNADLLLTQIDYLLKDGMKDEAKRLLDERLAEDPSNTAFQSASMRLAIGTRTKGQKLEIQETFSNNISALSESGRNLIDSPIPVEDSEDKSTWIDGIKNWSEEIEVFEKQLRELEGPEGTEWRYLRGRRLLVELQSKPGSDLSEVETLSNYLIQKRPAWNCTYVLSGLVQSAKGNFVNAIKDFSRAIRLGEQNIRIFEQLANLMLSQGQVSELTSLLERLGDRVNRSQRLSSIALGLSSKDQSAMLNLAKSGTESRPRDPMAWVWLAQSTELASRSQPNEARQLELNKAEQAITRARELSEDMSLPVFSAAFGLFLLTKQNDKMEALLGELIQSKIDPTSKFLALAEFYQVLDRMDMAQNALMEARKTSKDVNSVDDRIAKLMLAQGKQDQAINMYKTLYTNLPEDGSVRRFYVTLLASRGSEEDWLSIDQVYRNDKVADNPDDRRLRAELLARKGDQKDLALAQYLLESLVEDPKNRSDQDRFRLASIYMRNAALAEIQDSESPQVKQLIASAGKQLATLCRGSEPPAEYLYSYGDFLIRQERIVEANEISDRLNGQEPDHFASVLLRARLQNISGNVERAKSLLIDWKESQLQKKDVELDNPAKAAILAKVGDALNELGASKEAEKILRQAFELDGTKGAVYVRSLARSDDSVSRESAIRYLLAKLKAEKTPEVARLLAGLLSVGNVSSQLADQADEVLSQTGAANENDADLLLSIADMWLAQKKSQKSIDAYRKIVKLRPNDIVALNNLAILLGEQSDGTQEALSLIDQAIRIAGKQPLLLDSKAAILMLANRAEEAVPILEVAASATNDPRVIFHLYQALVKSGREEESLRIKSKINPTELRKSILTPDDQAALEIFEKEIQQ